jgi:uncharacterized membrane protein
MRTHYNAFAGGDVGRIEALSDGIFAFAATVLVLDFRAPEPADIYSEAELLSAPIASSHRLKPWLLRLLTLGVFWVAQPTHLSHLVRSNRDLTWLNLTFSRSTPSCRSRRGYWPISSPTALRSSSTD